MTAPDEPAPNPGAGEVIRVAFDAARQATPAPDHEHRKGSGGGDGLQLPDRFPVIPLGILGEIFFYLDAANQLRAMSPKDHSRLGLLSLVHQHKDLLYEHWPRVNDDGKVTGWRPEKLAEQLMAVCGQLGPFNAFDKLRGIGAWRGPDDNLVMHCGDRVWIGPSEPGGALAGTWSAPGVYGPHVYAAAPATPRFTSTSVRGDVAQSLLTLLRTWHWARPEIDPTLMLGWLGAALIGGALRWRPMMWITGDKSTGKSTLQELINLTLQSMVSVTDPSAAGIWQQLGHASLPVAVDEIEADEDNRRSQAIIKLARQASTGGVILRGGSDHKGMQFTARSCFLFSSILIPPMLPQDRSRLMILDLLRLGDGASAPKLQPRRLAEIGEQLRRRLVDGWSRLALTLDAYQSALVAGGLSGRAADQVGTLLACADLLTADFAPSGDELAEWTARAGDLFGGDDGPDESDHHRCLAHLRTSLVDVFRGGSKHVVNHWLRIAAGVMPGTDRFEATDVLATLGMRIAVDQAGRNWLAVANAHQGLATLFEGTHWAGRSGTAGVWTQALRRVPGAEHGQHRFAGVKSRCTMIPLDAILVPGEGEGEE